MATEISNLDSKKQKIDFRTLFGRFHSEVRFWNERSSQNRIFLYEYIIFFCNMRNIRLYELVFGTLDPELMLAHSLWRRVFVVIDASRRSPAHVRVVGLVHLLLVDV
jgi:hypothetical protein